MKQKSIAQRLMAAVLLGASSTALAHPGHDAFGLMTGLIHPLTGADHLLAMMAVGLWAAQSGGRRLWLLPGSFMLMLAVGAGAALIHPSLPLLEPGVAASVLVLGLLIALSLQFPTVLSVALTALFGFLHGYAHGLEMPGTAAALAYALGFLATTATLHLGGIAIGVSTRGRYARLAQALGMVIAASGSWMIATVVT
jgi:urease accessory protein